MNAMAQPSAIAHLELAFGRLTSTAVAPLTVLIAAVQLLLGAAMLTRRARLLALLASIPWALAVWALGEGFGNIATGYAMLPTGAPGAALAYAVLAALLVLDQRSGDDCAKKAELRLRMVGALAASGRAAARLARPARTHAPRQLQRERSW